MIFQVVSTAHATVTLDAYGTFGEDLYSKNMNCQSVTINFERKKDMMPILLIGDKKTNLPKSCYQEMSCVNFKGQPSVLIVNAPACGGNGAPEEYILYNIKNSSKTSLTYNRAKKEKLIK
jgi:hypothetical protein